jgi:hypothetical protein
MNENELALKTISNTIIVGRKRSGKTLEGFRLAKHRAEHNKQIIYTYKHPNPKVIETMLGDMYGGNINSILELKRVRNCVVLVDEAHNHFNTMERKVNAHLRDIMGLSTQIGVSLILITHSFMFLNESLMVAYIDSVIIKAVNDAQWEVDRRYARKLYGDIYIDGVEQAYVHLLATGYRSYITTTVPKWWKDEVSTAFASDAADDLAELFGG